jgi:hypothetical protein
MSRSAYRPPFLCGVRSRGMSDTRQAPDPRGWFTDDELTACPFCGEKAAVESSSKARICLNCEVVWLADGEPKPV